MSKKFLYIMSVLPWLFATSCNSEEIKPEVDNILVEKANRKLYLRKGDEVVREYSIGLGGNPIGHKQQEGDNRTPEGVILSRDVILKVRIIYLCEFRILMNKIKNPQKKEAFLRAEIL